MNPFSKIVCDSCAATTLDPCAFICKIFKLSITNTTFIDLQAPLILRAIQAFSIMIILFLSIFTINRGRTCILVFTSFKVMSLLYTVPTDCFRAHSRSVPKTLALITSRNRGIFTNSMRIKIYKDSTKIH